MAEFQLDAPNKSRHLQSKKAKTARDNPNHISPKFIKTVLPWVERYWHSNKTFPSVSLLMTQFDLTQEKAQALCNSKLFQQTCEELGIYQKEEQLSDKQVAAIAMITNTLDSRPLAVKLAAVGVSTEMYQGWLSHRLFKTELFVRSNEILDNLSPVAHQSLAKQVERGNTTALKMYYEMTGQSQSQETLNAQKLVQRTLEALQRHVRDPEALLAISKELLGEAPELAQTTVHSYVQPEEEEPEYVRNTNEQNTSELYISEGDAERPPVAAFEGEKNGD